ncbi:flavodoxin family protein [Lachnospiraceae bacterium ASD3451]|uniref:flavodoxin family protein BilS n=1 Tax=Diplocloster agilis TaxID=2850323 RepID=UPI001DAB03D2|nr:flavodoxin family protein BilS [Diplocloster agilis]MBU9746130.1 flavodoxin family protein [Diplocloster agilis]
MKVKVIYCSHTGNTAQLAQAIADGLPAAAVPRELAAGFTDEENEIDEDELIFAGFWVDKGGCPEEMTELLRGIHHRKVALFATAGFGQDAAYFARIEQKVRALLPVDNRYMGAFFCQGKMQISVRQRYEEIQKRNPEDLKIKQSIENFDLASTHPDDQDLNHAKKFAAEVYLAALNK